MKPRRSRRLTSQPYLSPESKLLRTKQTHLTGSKSPGKVRIGVPTTSKILVTQNISGIPAFTEEVQQPPRDSSTDPILRVSTCVTELVSSVTGSEVVVPQTSVVVDSIPSSAPKIFYRPDGLPLPPGLIAIEYIVEDSPSSTPSQFGVGITLYPSSLESSLPLSEAPVESLGNILDRLEMSEKLSTCRNVASDTAMTKLPTVTPTMFTNIPSLPTSSQSLEEAQSRVVSAVWFVPVCSSGVVSRNSYVGSQHIDLSRCQFGQSAPQGKMIPLSTGLPPYGGQYALSLSPLGGQPYGSSQQNLGYVGTTSNGWVLTLPQQPSIIYSMQQCLPMSNIPNTPTIVTVSQVQTPPVVCQPQSQVVMQQPFDPATQPQSSTGGMKQARMGIITPHLGQKVSIGQHHMVSQPWLVDQVLMS